MKQQLHFTISQKGGCGKTHVAFLLLSWAQHHKISASGVDSDPSNSSLADYQGLPVKTLEICDESGDILPERWDSLIYYLLDEVTEALTVIDVGATGFNSITKYIQSSNIFTEILKDKFEIFLNIPVTGGEELYDTLNGAHFLIEKFSKDAKIIIWGNEFSGSLTDENGNSLEDMVPFKKIKENIDGIVYLRKMDQLQHLAVEKMKKAKLTPEQTKLDQRFKLLEKSRINTVMNNSYMMLDQIFDLPTPPKKPKQNTKKEGEATA